MSRSSLPELLRQALGSELAGRTRTEVALAPYTSARIGGSAEFLLIVKSAAELVEAVQRSWQAAVPVRILGGGSNVLVSDRGVRGMVVLNRARKLSLEDLAGAPSLVAESGASLGVAARRAAARGWSGLEWAAGIPGTVGGAVVGNAGAHGEDVASRLNVATILQPGGQVEDWPVERLSYSYRDSLLKRHGGQSVVVAASFRLDRSSAGKVRARMSELLARRRKSQPAGASWGSTFKNPPGDTAGRLIEAAGLKGLRRDGMEISPLHANFLINHGGATATQAWELIRVARTTVAERFGVMLDLEIELIGEWEGPAMDSARANGGRPWATG